MWRYAPLFACCYFLGCDALASRCAPSAPCVPGGGGGPAGGNTPDAALDAAVDAVGPMGRVCVVNDLRFPTACATSGAADIVVTAGTQKAITSATGAFVMPKPLASTVTTIVATHSDFVTAAVGKPANGTLFIPTIRATDFAQWILDNAFILPATHGSVLVRTTRVAALEGTTVAAIPAALAETRYGGDNAIAWSPTAANSTGIALLAGLPAGTATIVATPPTGASATASNVPVIAGGLTFVTIALAPP